MNYRTEQPQRQERMSAQRLRIVMQSILCKKKKKATPKDPQNCWNHMVSEAEIPVIYVDRRWVTNLQGVYPSPHFQ